MSADAKAAMDVFCKALRDGDWEKALSCCTIQTGARAKQYSPLRRYFREFVPMDKLLAEPTYGFWMYSGSSGEYTYFGCTLRLFETPDGERVTWQWSLEKLGGRWFIDLPDVPVEAWAKEEIARAKRLKEETEARRKTLEPKLKGLRTRLTALQPEFRVGHPMPFRLELINEGQHELSYDKQQVAVNASMLITREDGRIVPYTAGPYQTAGGFKAIQPGETALLFASLDLAKQYDMTKPGKYRVQFTGRGLMIGDAMGTDNGVARQQFPSNTVEIEVKP